jgi:hypothetical protein
VTVQIPVGTRSVVYGYAEVDAADAERLDLASRSWCLLDGYAYNNAVGYMHRHILGLVRGEQRFVHHVDEVKLNNRRANLEVFNSRSEANQAPHPKRDAICALSADEREARWRRRVA